MMNLFNEVFLLVNVYHLCIFTPWTQSTQTKYTAGWVLNVATGLNIIVNISILGFKTVK